MNNIMMIAHQKRKNAAAAVEALDALDSSVGGDPLKDRWAANLLINFGGSATEAILRAERYSASHPNDIEGDFLTLAVYAYARDNVAIAGGLRDLFNKTGKTLSPSALSNMPSFSSFTASQLFNEYSLWYTEKVSSN